MTRIYRLILYILAAFIILADLGVFLGREPLSNLVSQITSPTLVAAPQAIHRPQNALDLSIFEDKSFQVLKNNINTFDFDSICKPLSGQVPVIIQSLDNASTSTLASTSTPIGSVSCRLGNNIPFTVKDNK